MKHFLPKFLLAVLLLLAVEISATNLSGIASSDVTLTSSGNPYILIGDYTIPDGFTLTVEPGVVIELNGYDKDLIIGGTLIANGTALDSILFTSINQFGGGSLILQSSSNTHSMAYCSIENLGFFGLSAFDTGLRLEDTDLTMDHCSFNNCGTSGIRHIVSHASVLDNVGPNNAVEVLEFISGTLDRSCTWPNIDSDGFVYRVTGDQVNPVGETLTIEPGVSIDLSIYTSDLIIFGSLIAIGNASDSIRYYGSDANRGGSIVLRAGASATLLYNSFSDLGVFSLSDFDTGLYVEEVDLSLDHSSFSNCGVIGERHIMADASAVSGIGPNNNVERIRFLNGTLDRTCTWPNVDQNGFTYVLAGDQTLLADDTLVIAPGVTLDFLDYPVDLIVFGNLQANGTAVSPISIYSSGINNGGSIVLRDGSKGMLTYLIIDGLGRYSLSAFDTGLYVEEADLSLDHASFSNCGTAGSRHITADASAVSGIGSNNDIERIRFLNGTLDRSCTWPNVDPNGFEYELAGDQTISIDDTLVIAPGVKMDFLDYPVDLIVFGNLQANGTAISPIEIYSSGINDGGTLVFQDGAKGMLSYMNIDSLGIFSLSAYDTGLEVRDAEVTADHLTFNNCGPGGVRHMKCRPDVLNDFGPNNSIDEVLFIVASVRADATWPLLDPDGVTYLITGDISIDSGVRLLIEPGVDVELTDYPADLLVNGALAAIGTAQDSIRFTGSGANGGGSIIFNAGSIENHMKYCSLNRLGSFSLSNKDAGVYTESLDLIIEKSKIRHSITGIVVQDGQPLIKNNIIKDNSILGLSNNQNNGLVNACDNYWGDPSGPYNATTNPTGTGNGISNNVLAGECYVGPLVIVCPDDVTVNVGIDYSTSAIGEVEVCIQDCAALASNLFSDDILDPQCTEDMIRTFTVTDTCGTVATCEQTVSFIDTTQPSISCPPNQNLACNQSLPAVNLGQVVALDNCGIANVTMTDQSQTVSGCVHTYTRRFKATDLSGNTARCNQTFTVKEDLNAPVLSGVPADVSVQCAAPSVPPVTATDDCDPVNVIFSESGTTSCGGTLVRTWSATDACGNSVVASQTITFDDTTAPTMDPAPADIEIYCTDAVPAMATLTASDNCGSAAVVPSEEVVGTCPAVITRTWVATDNCGNSSIETQVITVVPEPACFVPTNLDVVEIGFGTANARVNATWTNANATTDCEVRGGRIAASSIGTGTPVFANINNTQVISQTNGTTVLFNIGLYNNPNVPFIIGQTYGFEARCLCEDESGYSDWSGLTPSSTFVVPEVANAGMVSDASAKSLDIAEVQIYPNPSDGQFIDINITVIEDLTETHILIYDLNGSMIIDRRVDSDLKDGRLRMSFDTKLSPGIYLLQLRSEQSMTTQRFIVE